MVHVILLDRYEGQYGDDQYAVSDFGDLAFCRGQTRHDGTTIAAPKSHYREKYIEPKSLIGPEGATDAGRILRLNPVKAS